jgi:exonuclease III
LEGAALQPSRLLEELGSPDPHWLKGFDHTKGFPGEGPSGSAQLNIYFANITSWSDKAVEYLLQKKDSPPSTADIICVAEHHLVTEKLKAPRKAIAKAGRFSFITSATPTGQGGCAGGTMVLPRSELDVTKVRGRDTGIMNDWSACSIRGRARDLVVISLYLKDGEGMSPTNLLRLGQVHDLVQSLKVPWIILGDFNMSPVTLDQGGFLDLIGGGGDPSRRGGFHLHGRQWLSD